MFTSRFQAWVRRNALRLARAVSVLPFTPNQVTVAGTLLGVAAGALAGLGRLLPAGIVLAVGGTFDILDGALARATNRSYPYGAFLDSTLDRCSEGAVYVGIGAYFLGRSAPLDRWWALACLVALGGSYLVSYVRARAQSLGFRCEGGFFARPERVVLTVIGLVVGNPLGLGIVVSLLALLTNLTAVQRILQVWAQAREQRRTRKKEQAAQAPAGSETSRP